MSERPASMLNQIVLRDSIKGEWLVFKNCVETLSTRYPSEVVRLLDEAERRVEREGLFAAGYLTYEAASGFDSRYLTKAQKKLPVLCFGLFLDPIRVSSLPRAKAVMQPNSPVWRMSENQSRYFRKMEAIKSQIVAGNTYQINYTVRQYAEGVHDALGLFLGIASSAPHAAYVDANDYAIVSASPESFFKLNGHEVSCQPMKGTAKRGMTFEGDKEYGDWLFHSKKNRAENVMITDMVRNDLGRISEPGSIDVSNLFTVERHPTVWQMTSTVGARTEVSIAHIFQALFPSASVTGAPKVSSMELINKLEESPREIYTGAIGYLAPGRQAQFNVAIRTVLINKHTSEAVYGVGSGVVWDSKPEEEYAECITKAKILDSAPQNEEFSLLETMLWRPAEGIFLFDYHMRRLRESAEYFSFQFNQKDLERQLESLAQNFDSTDYRIRLVQHRDGRMGFEYQPVSKFHRADQYRIRSANQPIGTDDPFLYHKTTRRGVYERALQSVLDCEDVLLWNSSGFVTETSIANVVMKIHGKWLTPPIGCGLLAGTYRQWLLDRGKIKEGKVHLNDLSSVKEFLLINSVRGQYSGQFCKPTFPILNLLQ